LAIEFGNRSIDQTFKYQNEKVTTQFYDRYNYYKLLQYGLSS